MPKRKIESDTYGDWPVSKGPEQRETNLDEVAREVWPHARAHALRKLDGKGIDPEDRIAMAAVVWNKMLRSVGKTLERKKGNLKDPILDLPGYLMSAFFHRFNPVVNREERRAYLLQFVPSTEDLERLPNSQDTRWAADLERTITIQQIVAHMDDWTRRVWRLHQLDYSWKEIAKLFGRNEKQTTMKFRHGVEKARKRLMKPLEKNKPESPENE